MKLNFPKIGSPSSPVFVNPGAFCCFELPAAGGPSYKDVTNYATQQSITLPPPNVQAKQEQFYNDLKAAGILDQLDFLYVFYAAGSTNFAKINWINPGTFVPVLTAYAYDPTTKTLKGDTSYTSALKNGYKDTTMVKWKLADAGVFAFLLNSNDGSSSSIMFQAGAIPIGFGAVTFGNSGRTNINGSNTSQATSGVNDLPPNVFLHAYRKDGEMKRFKNGVLSGNAMPILDSVGGVGPNEVGFLGDNDTDQWGILGAGASLKGKEAQLYNAWAAYKAGV